MWKVMAGAGMGLLVILAMPAVRGAGFDYGNRQVMIESTIVSITHHEDLFERLIDLKPRQVLGDLAVEVGSHANQSLSSTTMAIEALTATGDTSPQTLAAIGFLSTSRDLQNEILASCFPDTRVKVISTPNFFALQSQIAAVEVMKGRNLITGLTDMGTGRFPNRARKNLLEYFEAAVDYTTTLEDLGVEFSPLQGTFEPYQGGRKKDLSLRVEITLGENMRYRLKKDGLELRGTTREPANGSVILADDLPMGGFSLFHDTSFPRLSRKKQQALQDFSFGFTLESDLSPSPAFAAGYEVQMTPEGAAQAFTFAGGEVVDIWTIPSPSLSNIITQIAIRDGNTLLLGGMIRREDGSTTTHTSTIPVLGELPFLRSYFRNGTKKNTLRHDNLMIFITPTTIAAD